jgi:hypothetical protein
MCPVALQHQKPQPALRKMRYLAVTLAAWPQTTPATPFYKHFLVNARSTKFFGAASVLTT